MAEWKPALSQGVDLRALPLTPEEGFVASRLDGSSDLRALAITTGLPREKVAAALEKLVAHGAVRSPAQPEPIEPAQPESPPDGPPPATAGIHRKLFETRLRALTAGERNARAKSAVDPELSAFCFDPLPTVVQALLENERFGLVQARLVAAHHRTPTGLEALGARAAFTADLGVRRALLRNPVLPLSLLRRLYGNRRLLEHYKLVSSRDLPEQTRGAMRELMRARFANAEPDERVEVIVKSEGRCLTALSGLPVDGKTTSLLCNRSYPSSLFVQNIARWSAAPALLLAHLLKQELVRRSPPLRALLLRHPNTPSSEKQR